MFALKIPNLQKRTKTLLRHICFTMKFLFWWHNVPEKAVEKLNRKLKHFKGPETERYKQDRGKMMQQRILQLLKPGRDENSRKHGKPA